MTDESKLDFSAILASSIHDMKNSLGMVLNSLEEIVEHSEEGGCNCTPQQVAQLQYEAKRVNDNLIQLLTVYKLETENYLPTVTEYDVADFLEECYLRNKPLLEFKGIAAEVEADDFLTWYFDRDLMAGVVDNVVTNALRYTDDRIRISAVEEQGWLVIRVEDNGKGFPDHMLDREVNEEEMGVDFFTGRTGLGLYFTSLVAGMHTDRDRRGHIKLSNGGSLGGGCFTIWLP